MLKVLGKGTFGKVSGVCMCVVIWTVICICNMFSDIIHLLIMINM